MNTGLDLVELPKAMRAYLGVRTKAMHLGTTSGLITKKFRGAFSRLAFREGCPLRLYSDNGYTFLGEEKALIGAFFPTIKAHATSSFSHQSLSWHFKPSGLPMEDL